MRYNVHLWAHNCLELSIDFLFSLFLGSLKFVVLKFRILKLRVNILLGLFCCVTFPSFKNASIASHFSDSFLTWSVASLAASCMACEETHSLVMRILLLNKGIEIFLVLAQGINLIFIHLVKHNSYCQYLNLNYKLVFCPTLK